VSAGAVPDILPGALEQYVVGNVPICAPGERVDDIRAALAGRRFDSADEVAVCREGTASSPLVGLIPMERLLEASPAAVAAEIMDADPPVVEMTGTNEEQAAWKAVRHGERSLAVLDAEGGFRGLIPPTRLLEALLRGHDEDFARLGGYLASTTSARLAVEERVPRRLWHRVPWLVVGLAGAAVSAAFMGTFEQQLQADVRIAFFVPAVVYLADAVGTQTEALVIRGLSVGASMGRAIRMEALTGLALGLLMAAVTFPAVWLAFGSMDLAAAVALALLIACALATVVAAVLPWAMARLGRDPAFGSGPLATVVQDLLSLMVYFAVAIPLAG
jgi:magnesium transporter